MAWGYPKFARELGVCPATTGAEASHVLAGLREAKLDQAPVLALTGMTYHDLIGTHYQQDVNTDYLFQDVAVYDQRIMGAAHLPNVVDLAIRTALARRGVSHLTIPID